MDGVTLGVAGMAVLLILILARMPVGAAMILVGFCGFGCAVGFSSALEILQTVPYTTFASQAMSRWPLWFLMLGLCIYGGLTFNLFAALSTWLSRFKAGTAVAALITCAFMGGMSAFGKIGLIPAVKILWPRLQKRGYSREISAGVLAAGFSLGILAPLPSAIYIIYGIITEQSIGNIFLCSIVPMLLSCVLYIIATVILCRLMPADAIVHKTAVLNPKFHNAVATGAVAYNLIQALGLIIVVFITIAGMLLGLLALSEASVVAVVLTVVVAALNKTLNKRTYFKACQTALIGTGWLFILMLGAMIFGYFLTITRLPYTMSQSLYMFSPTVILFILLLVIVLLGCLLEPMPLVLLVMPLFIPFVFRAGFHPVWFGLVAMRCIGLGIMLPYAGVNLRLVQRLTGIDSLTAAKGVLPFIAADVVLIILLTLFPGLVLFPL